uniref:Ribosomal RNA processing protein 1-like protein n=1 Tax=Syphacia muris TaxID=451379 RepID=A0A0N5AST3_9BILA
MDAELNESQIVLAQKLACGEPVTRKRAIRALEKWIKQTSEEHEFNEKLMTSLCKGLYYGMWMQDKMLLQESLADFFGNIINIFHKEAQSARYVKSFFCTISDEWPRVDRWRMDKFLMVLIRRLTRATFARLKSHGWPSSDWELYMGAFKETVLSPGSGFADGIKSHFASLYLDELDNAGTTIFTLVVLQFICGLSVEQVSDFLRPYAELLSERSITDYFFNSILDEIFITILHSYAEDAEQESDAACAAEQEKSDGLQASPIRKLNTVTSKRRKRIYLVVTRLKRIVSGTFGLRRNTAEDKLTEIKKRKEEFSNAVNSLVWDQKKDADSRKKFRKSMARRKASTMKHGSDAATTLTKVKVDGKVKKTQKINKKKGSGLKKTRKLIKKSK